MKGWPDLLGSLDVMHWEWKNCPKVHRGAYQGKEGVATIALEAAVDCRLWFWHAWFGMPGANNDLNILVIASSLAATQARESASSSSFSHVTPEPILTMMIVVL